MVFDGSYLCWIWKFQTSWMHHEQLYFFLLYLLVAFRGFPKCLWIVKDLWFLCSHSLSIYQYVCLKQSRSCLCLGLLAQWSQIFFVKVHLHPNRKTDWWNVECSFHSYAETMRYHPLPSPIGPIFCCLIKLSRACCKPPFQRSTTEQIECSKSFWSA